MTIRPINPLQKLLVASLFLPMCVLGQQETKDITHKEEVTIIGSFDPSINEAFKINLQPVTELSPSEEKPTYNFEALDIVQPTEIVSDPITPVTLNPGKRETTYDNILLAGMGSLLTPYFEFFHSHGQRNQYRLNAHVHHISTYSNIKGYQKSPYSKSGFDVDYSKFMNNHLLNTGIKYQLNTNRYYGYKPDDFPNADYTVDQLKQNFNTVEANVGLTSNYKSNKKLHHEVNLEAGYYFDKHKTTETNANLTFNAYKEYALTELLNYQHLGVKGDVAYYGAKNSLVTNNSTLITVTPYFKGNYGIFNFNVGLNFNFLNARSFDFYFYPILHASANLIDESLTAFAGIDGNVEYQGYKKLTTLNPWLNPDAGLDWDHGMRVFGGFRGNLAHKVNYSIQGTWKKFNNMYFFINQPQMDQGYISPYIQNKFITVFDEGSRVSLDAQVTYTVQKTVKLWVGAQLHSYSLDSLDQPYHKSLSQFQLGGSVLIKQKVTVEAELFGSGKRYALDVSSFVTNELTLDPYADLNLSVDYQLSDQFSVWLSGTNLLNNQYQRYYMYPVQGWQVMGGITYRF
ncbi:MAG: hypothetical protein WC341_02360 [Bacteroidales bacterium]